MITRQQLLDACRTADNAVDFGVDFEEMWRRQGVDVKDVAYVAEQRGLRMLCHMRGQAMPATPAEVVVSETERNLIVTLAAMWMDGLAMGLRVAGARRSPTE